MTRGEVWWAESELWGRRPALILTRSAAVPLLHAVLCAPATRTARFIPSEVQLGPEDGMPESCVLSLDNVGVIAKSLLVKRMCTLNDDRMAEVCRALALTVEC